MCAAWPAHANITMNDGMGQGIKIVDSASKRKVKQLLAAEAEMRKMEVESTAGWEEGPPSDVEDME